jgi:2-hydroxy-3-oxopropionate reductase
MSTIAFIGLGIMGSPMAVNLVKAGNQVIGYNRSPERAKDLVAAGGKAVDSIANAVAEADVVGSWSPTPPM